MIITAAAIWYAVSGAVQNAIDQGVKVISVDRVVNGVEVDCQIASDNVLGAELATQFIVDTLGEGVKVAELEGIPGASAAIEAHEAGAKVMVVTKLRMGDANTMMAEGGIQAADKPNDSPVQHYLDAFGGGHFAARPELLRRLVMEAPDAIRWLNDLGVMFDKEEDGTMFTTHGGGTSRKRMHAAKDYSGAEIMRTLRDEVLNRNIPVVDFTAAIEIILDDFHKGDKEWAVTLLRYFNPIGAHPSALIGELPRGVPQNLVPFITQTAAGIRECLSVFGDDYDTPDGSCLRDYIDVVDLAKAHVVAITRMVEDKNKQKYEIFNVGTGNGVSVLELVESFQRVNELKLNYKIAPRRPGDVVAIWADTTLANEELGWKAERSLDDTLRSAWAWEKNVRGIK